MSVTPEWICERITKLIEDGNTSGQIWFDELPDSLYRPTMNRVKDYVFEKGYHKRFGFYTDGNNWGAEDAVKYCEIGDKPSWSCWVSSFWTFPDSKVESQKLAS